MAKSPYLTTMQSGFVNLDGVEDHISFKNNLEKMIVQEYKEVVAEERNRLNSQGKSDIDDHQHDDHNDNENRDYFYKKKGYAHNSMNRKSNSRSKHAMFDSLNYISGQGFLEDGREKERSGYVFRSASIGSGKGDQVLQAFLDQSKMGTVSKERNFTWPGMTTSTTTTSTESTTSTLASNFTPKTTEETFTSTTSYTKNSSIKSSEFLIQKRQSDQNSGHDTEDNDEISISMFILFPCLVIICLLCFFLVLVNKYL